MERTKKEKEVKDLRIRFKLIGGGTFRLKGGKIIKPNQVFLALKEDIPVAFYDTVKALDGSDLTIKNSPVVDRIKPVTPVFSLEPRGNDNGWYDVMDGEGKAMNDKALKKGPAEKLLADLLED